MLITIIAAMDRDRVIGVDARLPWRLPADMRRFRSLTMGKPVIMGRHTHESIGKPLPGRLNIVLSRNRSYRAPGCVVVASLDDAIRECREEEELIIMGGAQVYAEALPRAGRMHFTLVHESFAGDTHFPEFDRDEWCEISLDDREADEQSPCAYSFVVLERKNP